MNCKPGDLAIVIHANKVENIGKIVKVIARYGAHYETSMFYDFWEVEGNVIQPSGNPLAVAIASDSWLRPISGIPIEEETQECFEELA